MLLVADGLVVGPRGSRKQQLSEPFFDVPLLVDLGSEDIKVSSCRGPHAGRPPGLKESASVKPILMGVSQCPFVLPGCVQSLGYRPCAPSRRLDRSQGHGVGWVCGVEGTGSSHVLSMTQTSAGSGRSVPSAQLGFQLALLEFCLPPLDGEHQFLCFWPDFLLCFLRSKRSQSLLVMATPFTARVAASWVAAAHSHGGPFWDSCGRHGGLDLAVPDAHAHWRGREGAVQMSAPGHLMFEDT